MTEILHKLKSDLATGKAGLIVKTNRPKTQILEYDGVRGAFRMEVNAAPEKGRANSEILKFFAKEFGLKIRIVSGLKSNKKMIKLDKSA